jgi:hypothetical protein
VSALTSVGPVVATFPATHPYVDAVLPAGVTQVEPRTDGPSWAPDPWWVGETWAKAAERVDVVHVHFGFDHVTPDALTDWATATHAAGVRLVLTVHDLRNPHHRDATAHLAQLAVLVAAADVVLTLTPGAAAEIAHRFGREAVVVPHPAIFSGPAAVEREPGLVGIHLKSYRTNLGDDVVDGVLAAAAGARDGGGRLEVSVHRDVDDDARTVALRNALTGQPDVTLVIRDRLDDDALRAYLTRLAVSVQLHRWGTHSGWLEACHDVGTALVAPQVGYLTDQWAEVTTYPVQEGAGPDLDALRRAVAHALAAPRPTPAPADWRHRQLADVRAAHARAYAP